MVRICLTEEGKKAREISKDVVLKFNKNVYNSVPKSKLKTFFEVISKLNLILDDADQIVAGKKAEIVKIVDAVV